MDKRIEQITNLINDACTNRVSTFASAEQAKFTDQGVREGIFEILGEDKLTWRGWRNHKNEIFTIIEEVLNTNLPLAWENSTFYDQFVETKNGALGDKNEYVVDTPNTLLVSRFAGNHWDTDRKKLPGKKSFSLDLEWIYIRVYDDFERFLKGIITIPEMVAKMQKAMQDDIDGRVYAAFQGASTYLPAAFVKSGTYDELTLRNLIEEVETATGRSVVIAGTRTALGYVMDGMNSNWISDSQKEERATKGLVLNLTGLGATGVVIPQTFIKGTYNFKINNKELFVLPDNEKFIKIFFEGDTRARELSEQDTHDQTLDTQIQTKLGVGCVFSDVFGKYTVL